MSAPGYIDAHCHLSDGRVFSEAPGFLARAQAAGVEALMLGGTDPEEWNRQRELKRDHPDLIRTSFGIHPWRVEGLDSTSLREQFELLRGQVCFADAIGETGLDFFKKRNPARFDVQREAFDLHLELARALGKPLVLHVVAAHAEALRRVKAIRPGVPMIVHAFSGSAEEAQEWVRVGAMLSFCGRFLRSGHSARAGKGPDKSIAALKAIPL
ncbi:MAG: TatD family deoxyribonuclease, partial [Proteobacteria bacterium]|nr:TatD family deoxyribonuclease [Pseudomonadota bacterium]